MAIHALADAVVRRIGSSQTLTDPASVVKELIDNALDARATNVSVEISSNSLDVIQVRDNGHGIAQEDRALVARRYCTSKIVVEDDLRTIGGSSLGFRGEALASVAELSQSLAITTRIECEEVAAVLKISREGEIIGQDAASAPLGTTVKITGFIKSNPVRRQVALKNADNTIKTVKRCLQAYAFARPGVRFSLKVLKAKTGLGSWVCAAPIGDEGRKRHVAFHIVGQVCASQCEEVMIEHNGFMLSSILPRQDAEPSKISNIGPFLSIDSRPVSSARGTMKQIVRLFREALRQTGQAQFQDLKSPFIFLAISCPKGCYDINVEPAKDDVLFEDTGIVLQAVRRLFESQYGKAVEIIQENAGISGVSDKVPKTDQPGNPVFVQGLKMSTGHSQDESIDDQPAFRPNMYGCDAEDADLLNPPLAAGTLETDDEEIGSSKMSIHVSNPWIHAKMNEPLRRKPDARDQQVLGFRLQQDIASNNGMRRLQGSPQLTEPLTPRHSSPMQPHRSGDEMQYVAKTQSERVATRNAQLHLPVLQLHTPQPSPCLIPGVSRQSETPFVAPNVYSLENESSVGGTPLSMIPDKSRRCNRKFMQRANMHKPFVPPLRDRQSQTTDWDRTSLDHAEKQSFTSRRAHQPKRYTQRQADTVHLELQRVSESEGPLIAPRNNLDIRTFISVRDNNAMTGSAGKSYDAPSGESNPIHSYGERGRDKIKAAEREGLDLMTDFAPASELMSFEARLGGCEKLGLLPRKQDRVFERPALGKIDTNALNVPSSSEERDGSHGLHVVGQSSHCDGKHRIVRTKSSRLPLERIPTGQSVQNIVCMSQTSAMLVQYPELIEAGFNFVDLSEPAECLYKGFDAPLSDLDTIVARLHRSLIQKGCDTNAPSAQQLLESIQAACSAHASRNAGEDNSMRFI